MTTKKEPAWVKKDRRAHSSFAGPVAAMTFVLPKPDEIRPGINSVFLVCYILEKSKTGETVIMTVNHFTSKQMWKHDARHRNVYRSEDRCQTVYNTLLNIDCSDGIAYAEDILSGKHGCICQYDRRLNFDTIWSSVFDVSNKKNIPGERESIRNKIQE